MQEQGKESSTDSQNKKKENNLKEKKDLICCHDAGLDMKTKRLLNILILKCNQAIMSVWLEKTVPGKVHY